MVSTMRVSGNIEDYEFETLFEGKNIDTVWYGMEMSSQDHKILKIHNSFNVSTWSRA